MTRPADGYVSGTKRHYRRRTWNRLGATEALSTPKPTHALVILDDWRALEARFLIEQRGYRPDQIHIAQRSPAKAARVTLSLRRAGHHGVHVHTRGAAQALAALASEKVRVNAVHLDFCGHVMSSGSISAIASVPLLAMTARPLAVCINVLRGREGRRHLSWEMMLRAMGLESDAARIDLLIKRLSRREGPLDQQTHCEQIDCETYTSTNGQSFLSMIATIVTLDDLGTRASRRL